MTTSSGLGRLLALVFIFCAPFPASAEAGLPPDTLITKRCSAVQPIVTPGHPADQKLRLDQLLGLEKTSGSLIRSPSASLDLFCRPGTVELVLLPAEFGFVWNSALPHAPNQNGVWAGRGSTAALMGGAAARVGPVFVILAPQLRHAENRDFQVLHGAADERSFFSSPWYAAENSADLPLRFGNQPLTVVSPGQSTLGIRFEPVAFGASSENQWWGPGSRNALVLSNHAEGFPHLFIRTTQPVASPLGAVEGRWILGELTESLYFDRDDENDSRSLNGLVLTLQPKFDLGLTIGASRTVFSSVESTGAVVGRGLDVLTRWHTSDANSAGGRFDQISALFGRWIFPESGVEVYTEWARLELPTSLRDLLEAPNHTQGYTFGLQWARPLSSGPDQALRLSGELTYLEQSATFRSREPSTFYTSSRVEQGYTHRGQVLGAAIGPGGSSQSVDLDYFGRSIDVGVFASRVRWNNDALYQQPVATFFEHDVSLIGGFRAGVRLPLVELAAEYTLTERLNYLFQNRLNHPGPQTVIDIDNHSFRLMVRARPPARGER